MARTFYFMRPQMELQYPEPWFGFDTEPDFRNAAAKRGCCGPKCLSPLLKALENYQGGEVSLGPAYNCWKAIGVLDGISSAHDAMQMLEDSQRLLLPEQKQLYGKIGGGKKPRSQALVLYCDSMENAGYYADGIGRWMKVCRGGKGDRTFVSRGCEYPFDMIFGPGTEWTPVMEPKNPEEIPMAVAFLRGSGL